LGIEGIIKMVLIMNITSKLEIQNGKPIIFLENEHDYDMDITFSLSNIFKIFNQTTQKEVFVIKTENEKKYVIPSNSVLTISDFDFQIYKLKKNNIYDVKVVSGASYCHCKVGGGKSLDSNNVSFTNL
jgi:hypothetical protein